ncbi:hypothetical protein [Jannaschia marina]|uniref:hypothetical protein n=1 Tax=Jannaschia marina TaxID=2741674 RepID=UPI0015C81BD2|nr:hypothetical protein [Jannaschia marina]
MAATEDMELATDTVTDVISFFDQLADEDLLRFLRSLPVIGANDDEFFSIEDLTYEALLQPYVLHAWKSIKGNPGISGRIQQLSKVYKAAEAALERETGRKRRVPRVINLPAFIDAYTTRGLPL